MEIALQPYHRVLLIIDAIINLVLGVLLLLAPIGMATFVGVPEPASFLYPCILGGVLSGIGLALLLAAFRPAASFSGLGIGGAIIINFCGAGVLLVWLLLTAHPLPFRGLVLLWSIVMAVLLVGAAELRLIFKHDATPTKS